MHLILIQTLMAQTDLLTVLRHFVSCIILIPQAPNMSLETSNTAAVWLYYTYLSCLFADYVKSRFMCSIYQ
jgi:hypothetical protein